MTLEAEIQSKERRLSNQKMQIMAKERDIHRLERRISELENKMRNRLQDLPGGARNLQLLDSSNVKIEPTIYLITPTYSRPTQKAELTRLSYTLMHIPNIHWIVIEDAEENSKLVEDVLTRSKIRHTLLTAETPHEYKLNISEPSWLKPKGVVQRNAGLKWLRTNLHISAKGVVYFADDDNTYDLRLFNEVICRWLCFVQCFTENLF